MDEIDLTPFFFGLTFLWGMFPLLPYWLIHHFSLRRTI